MSNTPDLADVRRRMKADLGEPQENNSLDLEHLAREISKAYASLSAHKRAHLAAVATLSHYERQMRVNHAETILDARNERTAALMLDGLKDNDQYRELEDAATEREADLFEAKCRVDELRERIKLLGLTL